MIIPSSPLAIGDTIRDPQDNRQRKILSLVFRTYPATNNVTGKSRVSTSKYIQWPLGVRHSGFTYVDHPPQNSRCVSESRTIKTCMQGPPQGWAAGNKVFFLLPAFQELLVHAFFFLFFCWLVGARALQKNLVHDSCA